MRRKVFLVITVLFLGVIFWNSSKPASVSDGYSKKIAAVVAGFVISDFDEMPLTEQNHALAKVNNTIRSTAHIAEFFVLGLLVTCFIKDTFGRKKHVKQSHIIALTLLICLLCAIADEVFQLFIDDRTFQFIDIFCDFLGASIGVLLTMTISKIGKGVTKKK